MVGNRWFITRTFSGARLYAIALSRVSESAERDVRFFAVSSDYVTLFRNENGLLQGDTTDTEFSGFAAARLALDIDMREWDL